MYCSASVWFWLHHSISGQTTVRTNFLMVFLPLKFSSWIHNAYISRKEIIKCISRNCAARILFHWCKLVNFCKFKKIKSLQLSTGMNILVKFYWKLICHKNIQEKFLILEAFDKNFKTIKVSTEHLTKFGFFSKRANIGDQYGQTMPLILLVVTFTNVCHPHKRNTELTHCSVSMFISHMLCPHLVSVVSMVFRHAKIGLQVVPPTGPGPRPISEAKNDQQCESG